MNIHQKNKIRGIFFSLIISFNSFSQTSDSLKLNIYRASNTRHSDIIHTRLDVKFDWDKSEMTGKASITAKPYFKASSTLTLDARGMNISSVEVFDLSKNKITNVNAPNSEILNSNKLASSYKYENDSININLGKEFKADEKYLVKINYTAKPNQLKKGGSNAISDDKGLYFINPKGEDKTKMPQIWTQGETQANSAWFPTTDSPNEKMTNEIYMTVDNKYTTLSNGVLTDSKKNADGTRTDHWKMDSPHSPYLVMMAIGEFKKVTDTPWNGKEISYYVEKEYEPHAKAIFGNTKEMIEFYSKVLGTPYPWQKYSQIVVRDFVSGAMENTSATLHGDFMVYQTPREMLDEKKGEGVIAHELFHQWFGDYVTAESWSNLPLNESFATYGEYLWEEYKNGRDAADARSYQSRVGYFNASTEKQVEVIRYHYNNREDMFDAWSYNKGGQILHMLRKYTGDEAFFASLKLYLERNKFKSAEIHDLRLAFEEITGEDLNWFFNEWFLAKGHPELEISKTYDASAKQIRLNVKQKQNLKETPLYVLPMDIDIYYNGKKERQRITINQVDQTFNISCPTAPDLVNVDAERQLLGLKTYTKTSEEFIFQYKNAPLYSDRSEALNGLRDKLTQENVLNLFLLAAEKDNWWELRAKAMSSFKSVAAEREKEIKPLLIQLAKTDKNNKVRGLALDLLSEHFKGNDLDELYKKCLAEQSYAILSSAIEASAKSNTAQAIANTKKFESEKHETIFYAVASVYSKFGNDENLNYFSESKTLLSGYGFVGYLQQYGQFLKRCNNSSSFELAANDFIDLIKTGNDYVKSYAKKTYQDAIIATVKSKADELKANGKIEKATEFENLKTKLEILLKNS